MWSMAMKAYSTVVKYSDGYEEVRALFLSEWSAKQYAEDFMSLNLHWESPHGRIEAVDVREIEVKLGKTLATVTREWAKADLEARRKKVEEVTGRGKV